MISNFLINPSADEWDAPLLADDQPFEVELAFNILSLDKEIIFEKGETFRVYPQVLRHQQWTYEIADGYAKGFMLSIHDCFRTQR